MRIGLAGSSGHVDYVIDALRTDESLSVVAVSPGAQRESIAEVLGTFDSMGQWPQVFESAEDMIRLTGIDLIVAAGPFYRNCAITMAALERDLPVFSEKPLALTLDDLRALEEVQRKSGRPICTMLGMRCEPHFTAAKLAMERQAVGAPLLVTGQKSYKLGKRPEFFSKRDTYGGTIPWVGTHVIDSCHWLTGKRFVDVTARHERVHNGENGDMESAAILLMTMEDNVIVSLNVDYLRPEAALTHGDDRLRIAGSQGVIEVRAGHTYLMADTMLPKDLELRPTKGILNTFIDSLAGNGENPVPTQDGIYATAAALLAREAADTGKTIRFADYGW